MYIATYIIDIAALFYLIWLLYSSTSLNAYRKKPFLAGIILTVIIILSEAGTIFASNGSANLRNINIICNILGFALTPMIPIVIALIIDRRILATHKLMQVKGTFCLTYTPWTPGTVTLLDSSTQEYEYQIKDNHPPIITESEFKSVQEEKKKRSNIVTD